MKKLLRVLVTRPEHQSEGLSSALENFGAEVVRFPTLKIIPVQDSENIKETGENIGEYEILIFISANAVFNAATYWDLSRIQSTIIAMGAATQRALQEEGVKACVMPDFPFTSESLLKMPVLKHIRGKKILLVTGEGGRPLLETELNQRGAEVTRLAVYIRECPATSPALLDDFWADDVHRIILCTSFGSMQNLLELTPNQLKPRLKNTALLVISTRLEELAASLNVFDQIVLSDNASDEAILAKIQAWYDTLNTDFK